MRRVGIIGGGLAPYFNEAIANQIQLLIKESPCPVLTCNSIGWRPYMYAKPYLILNCHAIIKRIPLLSQLNGAFIYLVIKIYEKILNRIIITGGLDSIFLRYLDHKKCVPIVTALSNINNSNIARIQEICSNVPWVIVQSCNTKKQLTNLGVDPSKIVLLYPLIDTRKFEFKEPRSSGEFRILFASAPNLDVPGEDNFFDKGVPMLLESMKLLIDQGEICRLVIVWRGKYTKELYQKITELNILDRVEIIDKILDMQDVYRDIDATVIPYQNLHRSPEVPSSALESLFSGRPVITTDVGEISKIVDHYDCGCVSKPNSTDFSEKIQKLRKNYIHYHNNCAVFAQYYLSEHSTIPEVVFGGD